MRTSSIRLLAMLGAVALLVASCAKDKATTASHSSKAPSVKVNPAAVQAAAAKAPAPPASATKRSSIGTGKAAVNTANAPGDTDSYWVDEIDIDGDGDVEETSLLWDDEDKVLFAYADTEVPCDWGGTASASILIGVNARGNSRNRPEGSGFYAVWLDATECDAEAAGLFGCRFDARGNATACGAVVVDEADDTVTIVAVR